MQQCNAKVLDLSFLGGVSTEHWLSLSNSLKGMPLEELHLHGNQQVDEEDHNEDVVIATEISGQVVASFADFITKNTNLCRL